MLLFSLSFAWLIHAQNCRDFVTQFETHQHIVDTASSETMSSTSRVGGGTGPGISMQLETVVTNYDELVNLGMDIAAHASTSTEDVTEYERGRNPGISDNFMEEEWFTDTALCGPEILSALPAICDMVTDGMAIVLLPSAGSSDVTKTIWTNSTFDMFESLIGPSGRCVLDHCESRNMLQFVPTSSGANVNISAQSFPLCLEALICSTHQISIGALHQLPRECIMLVLHNCIPNSVSHPQTINDRFVKVMPSPAAENNKKRKTEPRNLWKDYGRRISKRNPDIQHMYYKCYICQAKLMVDICMKTNTVQATSMFGIVV